MKSRKIFIYALIHPETNALLYSYSKYSYTEEGGIGVGLELYDSFLKGEKKMGFKVLEKTRIEEACLIEING